MLEMLWCSQKPRFTYIKGEKKWLLVPQIMWKYYHPTCSNQQISLEIIFLSCNFVISQEISKHIEAPSLGKWALNEGCNEFDLQNFFGFHFQHACYL